MNSIATIAAVICLSALACSMVSVVSPQGSTQKVLNTVLGAFILCAMIVPIKNAITDFNLNIVISNKSENLQAVADEAYNTAIMTETKSILEAALISHLTNNDIIPEDVKIQLDSYDNGGIYISEISIYISQVYENKTTQIITLTQEKFEVKPKIILR